jgi:hypothetical protein
VSVPFKGKVKHRHLGQRAGVDVRGEPCIDMQREAQAMLMRE